jgi:hypothetical protein
MADSALACPFCTKVESFPHEMFARATPGAESVFVNECMGCGRDYAVVVRLHASARELTDGERALFNAQEAA